MRSDDEKPREVRKIIEKGVGGRNRPANYPVPRVPDTTETTPVPPPVPPRQGQEKK